MKTLTLKEAQHYIRSWTKARRHKTLAWSSKTAGLFGFSCLPTNMRLSRLAQAELQRQQQTASDEAFRREVAAFERMKPELLKTHPAKLSQYIEARSSRRRN